MHDSFVQEVTLADVAATEALAAALSRDLRAGDLILLRGELGAGKSTFARALIRTLAADPALEIPSPTFTLVQDYQLERLPVAHLDLYRLGAGSELDELGLEEMLEHGAALVEWPERAADRLGGDRLEIAFTLEEPDSGARAARLTGYGAWAERLQRASHIERFLAANGYGEWQRQHLQGDASARRYERISDAAASVILMDAPARPDPGLGAVPYSRVAHLAEDVSAFAAIADGLRARGFSAPAVLAADLEAGLLLLEDLGPGGIIDADRRPIAARYELAVDLLVALHRRTLPEALAVAGGTVHRLPRFDLPAFLAEVNLIAEWYAPFVLGHPLPEAAREELLALWAEALQPVLGDEAATTWVMRDYHSPNLIWLPEREGLARLGLIDFQDAVIGPIAYDLASLAMDARVDVPEALEVALRERYIAARSGEPGIVPAQLRRDFAVMAAQRNTKVLGIFARLARRDGKPRYLSHLPRVTTYLERALRHPDLTNLRGWYDTNLPAALGAASGRKPGDA